ncbi:type II toxin-antitoxin system ParD family antitoxin [Candidatus Micrarchaeota archaeon]|nr:type II toxin-antitoxin system ParD family antitoxin [Candidatus Micrarchaeota archaeon]
MLIYCSLGDVMNIILGAPYEAFIQRIIEDGYAGNKTEVIRQALANYKRFLEEEETWLVHKGVEQEMEKIRSGKTKTYSYEEVLKKAGL